MRPGLSNPLEIVWHSLPGAKARSEVTHAPAPRAMLGPGRQCCPQAPRASETSLPYQMRDGSAKPRPRTAHVQPVA